jgi:hypothetical protein
VSVLSKKRLAQLWVRSFGDIIKTSLLPGIDNRVALGIFGIRDRRREQKQSRQPDTNEIASVFHRR